jgi:hypothetical protein
MRRLKFILFTLVLSIAIHFSYAQNLVPNPSFETFTSCPTSGSQLSLATPWYGVSTNSSDYYNSCGSGGANVPNGGGGNFQYARTGVAYAGIWAMQGFYREYIQVKLNSALVHDSCYLVEFYCNASDLSEYGIDKMAAALSTTAINTTVGGAGSELAFTPQIISNQFLADTVNWMKVAGYYKASGGEQYITIGNFSSSAATDTIHIGGNLYGDSYYYIDDVSITKVAGCDTVGVGIQEYSNNSLVFNIYPNPSDGNLLQLHYTLQANEKGKILVYDLSGKKLNEYLLPSNNSQLQITNPDLESGVYFYQIIINDRIMKSDKLIIIK